MVSWLRPRRSAITFDLGAAGIRAYQFQQRGQRPRLCDSLRFDLKAAPSRGQTDGEADDQTSGPRLDAPQLARLIGQGRFIGRDVAIVVSPPEVQFFPLHLPVAALAQSPERVQQALKWEVARQSRGNADSFEVRHWMLPPGRGQQANVMAVVMSSEVARQWCDLLDEQGLTLRRIDVSPCALVRLCRQAWTPAEGDLWGVLDLGLRHSTLTIVVGHTPTYIRSLSVWSQQWTRRLAAALEVSESVAEQLKREHGIGHIERAVGRAAPDRQLLDANDLPNVFSGVLRGSLHTLSAEVGRCFSYVMQSFPESGAKRLLLAGGGACLGGLPAVLAADLGIPVATLTSTPDTPATEWEHPLADVRFDSPAAAAALGSAILHLEAS